MHLQAASGERRLLADRSPHRELGPPVALDEAPNQHLLRKGRQSVTGHDGADVFAVRCQAGADDGHAVVFYEHWTRALG